MIPESKVQLGMNTVFKVEIKDAILEGSLVELITEQFICVLSAAQT